MRSLERSDRIFAFTQLHRRPVMGTSCSCVANRISAHVQLCDYGAPLTVEPVDTARSPCETGAQVNLSRNRSTASLISSIASENQMRWSSVSSRHSSAFGMCSAM